MSQDSRRAQVRVIERLRTGSEIEIVVALTVPGHRSSLAFGFMGDNQRVPVVAMLGRVRNNILYQDGHTLTDGQRS